MSRERFITSTELLELRDENKAESDAFKFFANVGYTRGVENRIYTNQRLPMSVEEVVRTLNEKLLAETAMVMEADR